MRRIMPGLLLGLVAIGCGGADADKPIDPDLYTATLEVKGMT